MYNQEGEYFEAKNIAMAFSFFPNNQFWKILRNCQIMIVYNSSTDFILHF